MKELVILATNFDPDQLHCKQLSASQGVVSYPEPFAELKAESKLSRNPGSGRQNQQRRKIKRKLTGTPEEHPTSLFSVFKGTNDTQELDWQPN